MADLIFFLLLPLLLLAIIVWKVKGRKKKKVIKIEAEEVYLLPFWTTIKYSYGIAWNNMQQYFKISWIWLILLTVSSFVGTFLYNASFRNRSNFCSVIHYDKLDLSSIYLSFLSGLVPIALYASVAVAWHRLVLRGEKVESNHYVRFDNVVLKYFILGATLLLINTVPDLFTLLMRRSLELDMVRLVTLLILLLTAFYSIRLSVMLPAIALESHDVTIKEVLRRTRRNFWRLLFIPVFCFLPGFLLVPLHSLFLTEVCENNIAYSLFSSVNTLLVMIIVMPIYLSYLSLAYKYLFERKEGD